MPIQLSKFGHENWDLAQYNDRNDRGDIEGDVQNFASGDTDDLHIFLHFCYGDNPNIGLNISVVNSICTEGGAEDYNDVFGQLTGTARNNIRISLDPPQSSWVNSWSTNAALKLEPEQLSYFYDTTEDVHFKDDNGSCVRLEDAVTCTQEQIDYLYPPTPEVTDATNIQMMAFGLVLLVSYAFIKAVGAFRG